MAKTKTLRNKLDKLWRTVGKESAGCEICKTSTDPVNYNQLHPHHMIKRRHSLTRWDLANRLWVCPTHHTLGNKTVEYNEEGWFWGADPDWLDTYMPGTKEYLEPKKHVIKKWKPAELEELIEEFNEL